jgi:hypothetical protein
MSYSPAIGTWLEKDPMGYTDGSNLYQFVDDDPTIYDDPQGTNAVILRRPETYANLTHSTYGHTEPCTSILIYVFLCGKDLQHQRVSLVTDLYKLTVFLPTVNNLNLVNIANTNLNARGPRVPFPVLTNAQMQQLIANTTNYEYGTNANPIKNNWDRLSAEYKQKLYAIPTGSDRDVSQACIKLLRQWITDQAAFLVQRELIDDYYVVKNSIIGGNGIPKVPLDTVNTIRTGLDSRLTQRIVDCVDLPLLMGL